MLSRVDADGSVRRGHLQDRVLQWQGCWALEIFIEILRDTASGHALLTNCVNPIRNPQLVQL